ncbi:MAG: hypothetical protein ACLP01_18075 [Solirubrobacteraceae bacterium]
MAAVRLSTSLDVLGPRLGRFLTHGFHVHLEKVGWTYELAYRVFMEHAAPRRAGQLALAILGGRALRRTIAAFHADVVVAEYPLISAALGELRLARRLPVPVCSSISDPAGLHYWAHPGVDLHLLSWPEARAEVDCIAGPGRAITVRPLVDRRFLDAPSRSAARRALDLPEQVPVVLVSGGGWGMGDLQGATQVVLAHSADTTVICLAGRNAEVLGALQRAFAGVHRVLVLGFSDQMPQLLAAADALVHTTGGTTALEARLVGCPLVNYGTAVAHVRAHARAMAAMDIAEYAPDRAALVPALARSLARGRRTPLELSALPDAAELVVDLAFEATADVRRPRAAASPKRPRCWGP